MKTKSDLLVEKADVERLLRSCKRELKEANERAFSLRKGGNSKKASQYYKIALKKEEALDRLVERLQRIQMEFGLLKEKAIADRPISHYFMDVCREEFDEMTFRYLYDRANEERNKLRPDVKLNLTPKGKE